MFECEAVPIVAFGLIMLVVMLDIEDVVILPMPISMPVVLLIMLSVAGLERTLMPVSVAVAMVVSSPEAIAISPSVVPVVSVSAGVPASVSVDAVAAQGIETPYVAQAELPQAQAAIHVVNIGFLTCPPYQGTTDGELDRLTLLISNTSTCGLDWPLECAEVLAKTCYIGCRAACATCSSQSSGLLRYVSAGSESNLRGRHTAHTGRLDRSWARATAPRPRSVEMVVARIFAVRRYQLQEDVESDFCVSGVE